MNLNNHDKSLLVALRKGKHFKANPGDAEEILQTLFPEIELPEVGASARRLHADGLAARVAVTGKEGHPFLRITDSGMAIADVLIEQERLPTWQERLRKVPRSDWIALFALLVSALALLKG
jgi:hypothetical protein